jgi:hypothetical protein
VVSLGPDFSLIDLKQVEPSGAGEQNRALVTVRFERSLNSPERGGGPQNKLLNPVRNDEKMRGVDTMSEI